MAPRAFAVIAAALAVVVAGCGSEDASPGPAETGTTSEEPTETPEPSPTETTKSGTTITTDVSEFGTMLFGADKQAIYIWEVEESSKPECYGDCAEAWPPVLTEGEPVASGEVAAAKLGTTKRKDGSLQVTYNGHPLYYYAHEGPNEVKCHNVSTHGGLWWVIQPDGGRAP